jgi:serine/threonine protein kinase
MMQPSQDTPRLLTGPEFGLAGLSTPVLSEAGPSDLRAWVRQARDRSLAEVVEVLQADQLERWGRDERVPAEAYLHLHPALAGAAEAFDLVYGEFLLRRQRGEAPGLDEYRWRFPQFDHQLRLLVELEDQLATIGHGPDPADGAGSTAPPLTVLPDTGAGPPEWPDLPGYEVLGELGRGGMGVVYLAEQRGLRRRVALKMIRAGGRPEPEQLARFRVEAEAVARLQHPNVVQVFEVGEHRGLPYLALEYCGGGSLAARLKGTPLPPREAAALAETLARAVHYAHQRGVVHRDLKPANVLLARSKVQEPNPKEGSSTKDQTPRAGGPWDLSLEPSLGFEPWDLSLPKVTDFGLAKRLDESAGLTATDAIVGTPSYMAPEQASGRVAAVGPLADVYALGAILYECLTGRPPFKAATALDTVRQVLDGEPVPPRRLQPGTPRDLETVCLKCLAKEPPKRYGTAEALADDLHRFLAGEPVAARPASRWERGVKWARRHPARAALLAVSAAAAVAVAVTVAVSYGRVRQERDAADAARQEAQAGFRKALQAVDQMLTRVGRDRLSNVPQMETVQRDLLEDALKFYQEFVQERGDDPGLREELGIAYRSLATVYSGLGQSQEAERAYRAALAVHAALAAEFPDEVKYRHAVAVDEQNLGSYLVFAADRPGLKEEAEASLHRAREALANLAAEYPRAVNFRSHLASTWRSLGDLLGSTQRFREAEEAYRQAIDLFEPLTAESPGNREYASQLARAYAHLGVVHGQARHLPEAERAFRRAVELEEQLAARQPGGPAYQRGPGPTLLRNLALLLRDTGRPQEAEQTLVRAVGLLEKLTADFPAVPGHPRQLADTLSLLADLRLRRLNRVREAREGVERAIGYHLALLKADPQDPALRRSLRQDYSTLAEALLHLGEHREAAAVAVKLPPLFPDAWQERLSAGWFLARCALFAEQDQQLSMAERQAVCQDYADRAVPLLREAVQRGYKDIEYLKKDPGLAAVRQRADFQQLLSEMAAPPPAAPPRPGP